MKRNRITYSIVILVIAVALSLALLPSSARDDWPEDCQLPDLEEAMSAANEAQANGDVAAYVNSLGEIDRLFDTTLKACLVAGLEDGVDMTEVYLPFANLRAAHLSARSSGLRPILAGAVLISADLSNVWLTYANLIGASLSSANLQGAYLSSSNMRGAKLINANLQGAFLGNVNLEGADLSGANLLEVDWGGNPYLPGANLQGVNLGNANLEEAVLWSANLQGVDLQGANLQGVDFQGANLERINLSVSDLQEANLESANLEGAVLWYANLQGVDLTDTIFNETTALPDAVWDDEAQTFLSGYWTPDTDMAHFTDPEHPDFWDPCVAWELDDPLWYCEDSDQ
jgi:uncharacterized protein YjbI with pentapeptide repeats